MDVLPVSKYLSIIYFYLKISNIIEKAIEGGIG